MTALLPSGKNANPERQWQRGVASVQASWGILLGIYRYSGINGHSLSIVCELQSNQLLVRGTSAGVWRVRRIHVLVSVLRGWWSGSHYVWIHPMVCLVVLISQPFAVAAPSMFVTVCYLFPLSNTLQPLMGILAQELHCFGPPLNVRVCMRCSSTIVVDDEAHCLFMCDTPQLLRLEICS